MQYKIVGGNKLQGEIRVSGNKNSTFPCMAAALLTDEEVILENVPEISDVKVFKEILVSLGASVTQNGGAVTIKSGDLKPDIPADLTKKLRGSIVLVGALLARLGEASFSYPGGDIIGQRSIDDHLEGFKALGANIKRSDMDFNIKMENRKNAEVFFLYSSVTGTENLILASVLGNSKVTLKNCAEEPHIVDLCRMLLSMGAKIEGIGTDKLVIEGVEKLGGTKFKLGVDGIEVGTYAVAAAISGGRITIDGITGLEDLEPILLPLSKFGVTYELNGSKIVFGSEKLTALSLLKTNLWPGFPTDMMSAAIILATQSEGVSLCHDWMYESRMFFVDKLISMGAKVIIADPHRVLVYGPRELKGRELETPDIRAGMALVLAALIAIGESVINRAELIERGYEDVVGKLKSLGADINKLD